MENTDSIVYFENSSQARLVADYMGWNVFLHPEKLTWTEIMNIVHKIENEDVGRGVILVTIIGERCKIAFNDELEKVICEVTAKQVHYKIEAVLKAIILYLNIEK